jgi:outer membrane lipoprotein-sorting protein
MRFSHILLPIACLCTAVAANAAPTANEIIAQARAKIGPENKLTAVKSIKFEGKVTDELGKEVAYLELEYKLPYSRREYALRKDSSTEIINASNGLEGYLKVRNGDNRNEQIRPFNSRDIKANIAMLQADTGFYAAPPKGKVTYIGEGLQQQKRTHILEYEYEGGIIYRRYFDIATSLLVAQQIYTANTPEDKRTLVIEEGELIAEGGLRFPKKTTTYDPSGKKSVCEYTDVKVNLDIPDTKFAFPLPIP